MRAPTRHPVTALLRRVAAAEEALVGARIVAPLRPRQGVRTRIDGLVHRFDVTPDDFEGFAVLEPWSATHARVLGEATLPQVDGYLRCFPAVRMVLARRISGHTWAAAPLTRADRDRLGGEQAAEVHLVRDGARLAPVVTRFDGAALWYDAPERTTDPRLVDLLREWLGREVDPAHVRARGLTPEIRNAYRLALQGDWEARRPTDERRLRAALAQGGGTFVAARDRGGSWFVEWRDRRGHARSSLIDRRDLTVRSAGICLDGTDHLFDLQSLVGVMEGAEW